MLQRWLAMMLRVGQSATSAAPAAAGTALGAPPAQLGQQRQQRGRRHEGAALVGWGSEVQDTQIRQHANRYDVIVGHPSSKQR
jgi:hypothetical protein